MENFYELFQVKNNASKQDIIYSYMNNIKKYNTLKNLTLDQINEIKSLKTGLYILLNPELRTKYNNLFFNKNNTKLTSYQANDNLEQVVDINLSSEYLKTDNLDSLFTIDNSWMNKKNETSANGRKNKNENNIIGNRIFSLKDLNKRPNFSSDFESKLRKPHQGRIDKNNIENS